MPILATIRLSRAPIAALALIGIFWGGFAGMMPDIKALAGVSDAQLGAALMASAIGSMLSMYFAPRYVQIAARLALPLAGAALVIAFFYPLFATDMHRLTLAMALMGASVGLLDISANIRIGALEARHSIGLMNLNHAMFSFGFGGAALATGLARQAGFGPAQILPVLAMIGLLMLLALLEPTADWGHLADDESPHTRLAPGRDRSVVLLTAVVLFASFVGENSTEAWSALHIERTLGAEVGHGSFGPAVLGLVMGVARFFGQAGANRLGEIRLILWSAVLGVAGAVLIAVAWTPSVVLVGVGIVAVGMAVIVPSANTVLGRRVSARMLGVALSRAWMLGMVGFFLGPAMMGLIAEFANLRGSYLAMGAIIALIVPAILRLGQITPIPHRNQQT